MLGLTLIDTRTLGFSSLLALALGGCADAGRLAGPAAHETGIDEETGDPDLDGEDDDGLEPADGTRVPRCDVLAIVQAKCQGCHASQPLYGAPMPLVDQADFEAAAPITQGKSVL